jgi:hypothetical protein
MLSIKATTVAIAIALSGTSGLAQAVSYSVSTNTISNFGLTFSGGAGGLMPFTFSTNVAAQGAGSDANFGTTDANAACVGAFCTAFNNSFTAHGASGDYAYGDALISSANVQGGVGSASSIGEISAPSQSGFANGANSMTAFFTVTAPGAVAFSFSALPYMQLVDSGTAFGSMSITISQGATTVFSWAPNGVSGPGISGGTESADGVNLNLGLGPNSTYNPGPGSFAAMTGSLGAGQYTLNISMSNQVSALPVPEADTWAMLLAGLGLVGLVARRRSL